MLPGPSPADHHVTARRAGEPAGEEAPGGSVAPLAVASVAAPLGLYVGAELVQSAAWGRALSGASMGAMAGLMGAMTLAMGDMDMGDTHMTAMPTGAATLPGHAIHPNPHMNGECRQRHIKGPARD